MPCEGYVVVAGCATLYLRLTAVMMTISRARFLENNLSINA